MPVPAGTGTLSLPKWGQAPRASGLHVKKTLPGRIWPGRVFYYRERSQAISTSSPSFLTGLTRSSRLTPIHMASAAATNTDE
ncbi:Uncharacterised protein [Bordetella pertussis]|nr:Uncharacterised protein [Bordetella pertussis]CFW49297.1 Uncharacterised protein [Bordetella pertussis]